MPTQNSGALKRNMQRRRWVSNRWILLFQQKDNIQDDLPVNCCALEEGQFKACQLCKKSLNLNPCYVFSVV